jgi:hypothetical protein
MVAVIRTTIRRSRWHTGPVPDITPRSHAQHAHPEPSGPPVKWQTVSREWDRNGRLLSERTTVTEDTDCETEEPERLTGMYL